MKVNNIAEREQKQKTKIYEIMKLKDLIKVIFGEDMKFVEVKIAGTESMLKADGEDFVVGQPIYLVEVGKEPMIIDSEAEFILEDGRKIETGSDGTITEISTESIEDAVEQVEEEMAQDPEMKKEMEQMPEGEKKEEEMGENKKEEMEDPMKSLSDRIDELTSKLDNIQKSLPENMMEEMEKMKKEIKMLKNEPIAEKFEAESISNPVKSNDFKSYLITLQKNIN